MPAMRLRPALPVAHPVRQVWLFALAVGLAFAALSAATSSRVPSAARVPVRSAALSSQGDTHAASSTAGSSAAGSTQGATSGEAVADASARALPRPAAVHTMSMDAPIQHGLTAHQEQAISARLIRTHHDVDAAPPSPFWTPAMGRNAVARAKSWLGMPYSWAGGTSTGPTLGRCVPGSGGDLDCHVVGFDCSGLMMYAWGPYVALPHLAATQQLAGAFRPTLAQLRPGDLVFFAGYLPGGTGHVAIYAGHGMVIEAPQSGSVVRETALSDVLASDGAYRGAVRPLTAETPVLAASTSSVPTSGGLVTLRGTHLSNVDAVHLDGVAVTRFVRHSDSVITFRSPAHRTGAVAVVASTPWSALSKPVPLTYARSERTTTPAPATTAPVTLAPPSPPGTEPAPKPISKPTSNPTTKPSTTTPSTAPTPIRSSSSLGSSQSPSPAASPSNPAASPSK